MESPNHLIIVRGDVATATSRTASLVGRGITALNGQRHAALLAEAQQSRYQSARAVFNRQFGNPSESMSTDEEAQTLYKAYCTLRELADAGFMRANYPVAFFLREGWRILPKAEATPEVLAADRVERIRRYVLTHALCIYQDNNLAALIAENPVDIVSVIEWCAEHCPEIIPASKAPPEYLPLSDLDKSLEYESAALAWLDSLDSPDEDEVWHDMGAIHLRGHAANDAARAFQCFETAAADGFAAAQFTVGSMHHKGYGVQRDDTESVRWNRLSALQGYAPAQYNLGVMYATGRGVEQDDAETVRWYRLSALQGNAHAQHGLGQMYAIGRGVERDDAEAVRWYQLSAQQGNATAQSNLGLMYEKGRGVERDDGQAVHWYRLSAQQINASSQCSRVTQRNLGRSYADGRGVKQDNTVAVRWYQLSAKQGDPLGQQLLGSMYANGHGVTQDDPVAMHWYQLSAKQGYAAAQCNLGWMYENGRGVERDNAEAVRWYQLSAQQGNDQAQYNLGLAYEFGRGTDRDLSQAQYWYQKSADQNHTDAMGRLAMLLKEKLAVRNSD